MPTLPVATGVGTSLRTKLKSSNVRQNSESPESLYLYALHFSPTGLQNGDSSMEPSVLDLWQSDTLMYPAAKVGTHSPSSIPIFLGW
ncbi:hypothetical protein KC358_g20 [Hortaea werneckii]|nr:hypothetical protein KC358_g20 [Hortaea werneckii]